MSPIQHLIQPEKPEKPEFNGFIISSSGPPGPVTHVDVRKMEDRTIRVAVGGIPKAPTQGEVSFPTIQEAYDYLKGFDPGESASLRIKIRDVLDSLQRYVDEP